MIQPSDFQSFFEERQFPFAVVSNTDGTNVFFHGQPSNVESASLFDTLFFDAETIRKLYSSLEGAILPRMWSHGSARCIICMPTPNLIGGIFLLDDRDVATRYRESKLIAEEMHSFAIGVDTAHQ